MNRVWLVLLSVIFSFSSMAAAPKSNEIVESLKEKLKEGSFKGLYPVYSEAEKECQVTIKYEANTATISVVNGEKFLDFKAENYPSMPNDIYVDLGYKIQAVKYGNDFVTYLNLVKLPEYDYALVSLAKLYPSDFNKNTNVYCKFTLGLN